MSNLSRPMASSLLILKSPITTMLSYVLSALQTNLVNSSKKIIRLLSESGLYTLKHIHFLLDIVNSEQMRMNRKQFLLYKKLFGRINHHQLLDEYVLHNFSAFRQTLLIFKSN